MKSKNEKLFDKILEMDCGSIGIANSTPENVHSIVSLNMQSHGHSRPKGQFWNKTKLEKLDEDQEMKCGN